MWHNWYHYGPTTLVLFPALFDWKIGGIMELYLPVLPVPRIVPPSHSERCESAKTKPIHSEFILFEFSWTAAAQLRGLLSARRIRVRPLATKYVPVPSDCNLASSGMNHFFKLRFIGIILARWYAVKHHGHLAIPPCEGLTILTIHDHSFSNVLLQKMWFT